MIIAKCIADALYSLRYRWTCWAFTIALASPFMGLWGTCPLDFQLFNFSSHFRAAQTLTWLLIKG